MIISLKECLYTIHREREENKKLYLVERVLAEDVTQTIPPFQKITHGGRKIYVLRTMPLRGTDLLKASDCVLISVSLEDGVTYETRRWLREARALKKRALLHIEGLGFDHTPVEVFRRLERIVKVFNRSARPRVCPREGSVIFGCVAERWAFRLKDFAAGNAERLKALWGDFVWENGQCREMLDDEPYEVSGFVTEILNPLWEDDKWRERLPARPAILDTFIHCVPVMETHTDNTFVFMITNISYLKNETYLYGRVVSGSVSPGTNCYTQRSSTIVKRTLTPMLEPQDILNCGDLGVIVCNDNFAASLLFLSSDPNYGGIRRTRYMLNPFPRVTRVCAHVTETNSDLIRKYARLAPNITVHRVEPKPDHPTLVTLIAHTATEAEHFVRVLGGKVIKVDTPTRQTLMITDQVTLKLTHENGSSVECGVQRSIGPVSFRNLAYVDGHEYNFFQNETDLRSPVITDACEIAFRKVNEELEIAHNGYMTFTMFVLKHLDCPNDSQVASLVSECAVKLFFKQRFRTLFPAFEGRVTIFRRADLYTGTRAIGQCTLSFEEVWRGEQSRGFRFIGDEDFFRLVMNLTADIDALEVTVAFVSEAIKAYHKSNPSSAYHLTGSYIQEEAS